MWQNENGRLHYSMEVKMLGRFVGLTQSSLCCRHRGLRVLFKDQSTDIFVYVILMIE